MHLHNISEHVIPQIASLALSFIEKSSEKAGKSGQFSNIHKKCSKICTQMIEISHKMGPNTLPETKNLKSISVIGPEIQAFKIGLKVWDTLYLFVYRTLSPFLRMSAPVKSPVKLNLLPGDLIFTVAGR